MRADKSPTLPYPTLPYPTLHFSPDAPELGQFGVGGNNTTWHSFETDVGTATRDCMISQVRLKAEQMCVLTWPLVVAFFAAQGGEQLILFFFQHSPQWGQWWGQF